MTNAPVFADGLDEIAQEFLVESYENLDELDRALVELEKDPGSRPLIASIFRTIHTIKGTSGFLAFNRLEAVTHVGENVLSKLRDGKLDLTPEITTVLLQMVDVVRALLAQIENDVEAALARCLEAEPAAAPAAEAPVDQVVEAEVAAPAAEPVAEPVAVQEECYTRARWVCWTAGARSSAGPGRPKCQPWP